jgi:hypothetical protein
VLNGRAYAFIVYPGQAHQLADAGFTRESLVRFIADYKAVPREAFNSDFQEGLLKVAESGKFPGLTVDNCKSGGKIPVMNSNRIAVFVAGHMSGQTLGLMCMGSYGGKFTKAENTDPCGSPFNIKKITGATLTKAGKLLNGQITSQWLKPTSKAAVKAQKKLQGKGSPIILVVYKEMEAHHAGNDKPDAVGSCSNLRKHVSHRG